MAKKLKKAIIKPRNNDDNCSQYAFTVVLDYQNIQKKPQRVSKIKPFIDQYNWKEIDCSSPSKDWNKSEQNKTTALNILIIPHNTKKIKPAYKSKQF